MVWKIRIFSFLCLIGYFYKQDAEWKTIWFCYTKITILWGNFTSPEPLWAGHEGSGLPRRELTITTGLGEWGAMVSVPSSFCPSWGCRVQDCLPAPGWCTQLCPCRLVGQDSLPALASRQPGAEKGKLNPDGKEGVRVQSPAPFPTWAWGA